MTISTRLVVQMINISAIYGCRSEVIRLYLELDKKAQGFINKEAVKIVNDSRQTSGKNNGAKNPGRAQDLIRNRKHKKSLKKVSQELNRILDS